MTTPTSPGEPHRAESRSDISRNLGERATRGVFWAFVGTSGGQVLQLVVFLILARLLEPREIGLVALAAVFLDVIDTLVEQGFGSAIVQRADLEPGHLDAAFLISVATSVVLAVMTIAAAPLIAAFLKAPELTNVLRVMSVTFLFVALRTVQDAQLRRSLRFRYIAARQTMAVSVGGVVGIAMAAGGFGVWSLVGQQIAREFTAVVVLWQASPWRPRFAVSRRHLQELWGFGVNITGARLLDLLGKRAGDLLIGRYLGPVALGYYSVAQRLSISLTRLVVASISQVSLPTFAVLQEDLPRLRQTYYRATRYASLVAFPAFLGAAALAPVIIPAWFGEKWEPSARVMQILAVLGLTQAIVAFNATILQALGRARTYGVLVGISAVTSVAAIGLFVRFGIEAVALALLVRAYVEAPLVAWYLRRYLQWETSVYLKQFVTPTVASAVVVVAAVAQRRLLAGVVPPTVLLAIAATVCAVLYVATVWLISPDTARDATRLVKRVLPGSRAKAAEPLVGGSGL